MGEKIKLLFFFVVLGAFVSSVNAGQIYTCSYETIGDGNIKLDVTYDIENDSASIKNKKETFYNTYNYYSKFRSGEIKSYKQNECPTLYVSEVTKPKTRFTRKYDYTIYSDSYLREKDKSGECVNTRDTFCWGNLLGFSTDFYELHLTDDSAKKNTEVTNCYGVELVFEDLEKSVQEHKKCDNINCKTKKLLDINHSIDKITNYCRSSLQYRNVTVEGAGGEEIDDPCITICLNLEEEIKKYWNPNNKSLTNTCGFSERLLVWVNNIMKWIKYILPVLVIILGIIDYIKAIGTDKDDEMKKAQGRFIKRLIAAALAFIIPLIVSFILDKMGFDVYSCGVDVLK